jgi:Abnormal spindle-like microcephaly-assoc'd, ASPM-SPD-2-Hydin
MKKYFPVLFCALSLSFSCGGGPRGGLSVGSSPSVTLSPTVLTFGIQDLNTTSQPLSLTLTNSGTSMLQVAAISASGNFQQSTTCGTQLAAGASCAITVVFTPNAEGSLSGAVSIHDNAADTPQKISLSGTGSSVGGSCSVQPQQCGSSELPLCCSGLTCTPTPTGSFCQP